MSRVDGYSIAVRQTVVDGALQFEATVREFPDIVVYEDDASAAYAGAREAIETSLEVLSEIGIDAPACVERESTYSGRVTLRLPKWLHRHLAETSEADGSSLNQHIVNNLIEHAGIQRGRKEVQERWSHVEKTVTKRSGYLRLVKSDLGATPVKKWAHE